MIAVCSHVSLTLSPTLSLRPHQQSYKALFLSNNKFLETNASALRALAFVFDYDNYLDFF